MTDKELREKQRRWMATGAPDDQEALDAAASRAGLLRSMTNEFHGVVFYHSSFNPVTGSLVRVAEDEEIRATVSKILDKQGIRERKARHEKGSALEKEFQNKYGWGRTRSSFSPVPETIDVAINNWCNYGCSYCYMDATTRGTHAPIEFVSKLIEGFEQPPYQIAYGGGSPTHHPQFAEILRLTRELGVVPNYTTEGQNFTPEIIRATNETCGGVALTYHAHRGAEVFAEAYKNLRNSLAVQLNVHVIADRTVVDSLNALLELQEKLGPFRVVLLAYYPETGRGNMQGLMPKHVYMETLPATIQRFMAAGNQLAFSEGLIPYFLSRPEIGVDTRMATPVEGRFSCYVDMWGRMSHSSFSPTNNGLPPDPEDEREWTRHSVFNHTSQELWNQLNFWGSAADNHACDSCQMQDNCTVPDPHHYFICKYAEHNDPRSKPYKQKNWNSYRGY